jgi:hypothetical protein
MEYQTTYRTAVEWFNTNIVLCNKLPEIDPSVIDNLYSTSSDDDIDEIFQWYITDATDSDVEWLTEHFGLIFTYSELLECNILCVNHYGTSWDYVTISTDIKQAERKEGEGKNQ